MGGVCFGEGFYLPDPCELTFANTLLLSNAAVSLGGAFVSLEILSQFLIFFSLFSFILAWTFISLQIKEFRIMGLSINDSVYSSLFLFSYRITFLSSSRWSFSSKSFFGVVVFLQKKNIILYKKEFQKFICFIIYNFSIGIFLNSYGYLSFRSFTLHNMAVGIIQKTSTTYRPNPKVH